MKVLVCIPCLMTGGTEIQTLNLVSALVLAGHEVATVCYFEYSQEMVENYKQAGSKVILLSPDSERPEGIKDTVRVLFNGFKNVLKCEKPEVVHVQYMAPGAIPIFILRLLGVKRIVATAHTSGDIYPSLKLLHFVSRYILTAFQCITKRAEESFFGSSCLYEPGMTLANRGNHFTIYNSLPPYIAIADTPKRFDKPITIGVVSRLEPIKGMDLVIPAFTRIYAKHAEARLLVVGDGSLRSLMEQQVRDANIAEVVDFAGRQGQDVLQGYYDRIDILLMPSRSEGFGLTAIEGMARGCVVVAADTGGLPEVVINGEVGLLHRPDDIDDIVDKLYTLFCDRALLEQLGSGAMVRATRFSMAMYSRLIADLYVQL